MLVGCDWWFSIRIFCSWETYTHDANLHCCKFSPGVDRRLLKFWYLYHPTESDVTSGLNCTVQLVSQSEKMAFRFGKIFFYLQTRFVSFQTEGRKMLQAHFFDFRQKTTVHHCFEGKYLRAFCHRMKDFTHLQKWCCSHFWFLLGDNTKGNSL